MNVFRKSIAKVTILLYDFFIPGVIVPPTITQAKLWRAFKSDSYLNFQFCFISTYWTKVVFAYLITHYLDIAMNDEKALTTNSKSNGNNSNLNWLNQIFTLHWVIRNGKIDYIKFNWATWIGATCTTSFFFFSLTKTVIQRTLQLQHF